MLFTDGACLVSTGVGGWGFILQQAGTNNKLEGSGGEHNTTNNRMEIIAVIKGLESLRRTCQVEVVSDSQYVVKAIMQWLAGWKLRGWKHGKLLNVDLWKRLDELCQIHVVCATWVRGHSGHAQNERCDTLATAAAARVAKTPAPPVILPAPPPDLFAKAG